MGTKVTRRQLATAGLPAEGVYRFRIDDAKEESGTSRKGNAYTVLHMDLKLLENSEGPIAKPISLRESFWTSGHGLAKFNSLYKAIRAELPPANEDGEIDLEEAAIDLKGMEAWGAFVHGDEDENGKVYGNFLYRFADNADGVKFTPRS